MCNSKSKTMGWLLGLMVLALFAFTSQVAYGQAGVGVTLTLNSVTDAHLHVGTAYNGAFTITSTDSTPVSETVTNPGNTLVLVPACKVQLSVGACPSGDAEAGVIKVLSVTTTATSCVNSSNAQITFAVTDNGDGTFNLQASDTIFLATFGSRCAGTFAFDVVTLPSVDSRLTGSELNTDASLGGVSGSPILVMDANGATSQGAGQTFDQYDD